MEKNIKYYRQIVDQTYEYVLEKSHGNREKLDYYLTEWQFRKPKNIQELYRNLLETAKNRQGMPQSIGDVSKLREILFDFNPKEIYNSYNNWEELFYKIQADYSPPGRMEISNSRNYWVIYTKSIISTSKFLSRFETLDSFTKYVNQFVTSDNIDLRISLPLLLGEELFGFRFTLACDFIKENVSPKFVKPDVHINDIFKGIGVCQPNDSDFEVFRKLIYFSEIVNKEPYWVDKLFWLVGHKEFYENKKYLKPEKIKTDKNELIRLLNTSISSV